VCAVYGSRAPLILRPDGDHYQFVGYAFIDGFWEDDMVEKLKNEKYSKLEKKQFEIR
jgi:hypothetical protein